MQKLRELARTNIFSRIWCFVVSLYIRIIYVVMQ